METVVHIGTRGSRLARVQTAEVVEKLRRVRPDLLFEERIVRTRGDRASSNGETISGTGWFTGELEEALRGGEVDLAVHSLKDLPASGDGGGLVVAAVLPRQDARDLLIFRPGDSPPVSLLNPGDVLATGSPRRSAQMTRRCPGIRCVPIRGNVETRLRKLRETGEFRAVVLAAAGLRRIGWFDGRRVRDDRGAEYPTVALEVSEHLPAPGQAAVAVQAKEESVAGGIAEAIDDPDTRACVRAERTVLSALGGGCRTALGTFAAVDPADGTIRLKARLLSADGGREIRVESAGSDPEIVGRTAAGKILAAGGRDLLREGEVS